MGIIAARALVVASLTLTGLITWAVPLVAHHRTGASYDQEKTMEVKGRVMEFTWKSPHSALLMNVTDGPYKGRKYAVELNGPSAMARLGWTKTQFQVGDEVVINVHPSKTGAAVGECLNCTVIVNRKQITSR